MESLNEKIELLWRWQEVCYKQGDFQINLGRSCSNICLSIKSLTNKGGYESNSLWSMTWKETICKSFTSLWLCCLCFETSSNSSKAWWKIWKCIFIDYCTQLKPSKLYHPLTEKISVRRNVIFDKNVSCDWSKEPEQQEITVEISEKIFVRRNVIFDKNVSWDWCKEPEQQEFTVEVSLDEETRVNSSASPSASTATQNLSNSSSLASLKSNSSLEKFSNKTPPRKYKSLADIYASC